MASYDVSNPDFSTVAEQLTTQSPGHADTFNPLYLRLFKNDAYLKQQFDEHKAEGTNNEVVKQKRLELKVDTRTTQLIYTNGNLTQVLEKDGDATIKTTTLNYDVNGNLTSVVETAGGSTVTTTLNYDSGQLSKVTKAVA